MMDTSDVSQDLECAKCGTPFPREGLSCPNCRALRHSARLRELQIEAEQRVAQGDAAGQRRALLEMRALVPPASKQYAVIQSRLAEVGAQSPNAPPAKKNPLSRFGALGALGLMLWKFKWVFAFVLTKGKAILLGLSNAKTALSMLIALGAYWTLFGWPFALGFVLSIYVHEMGHVIALRRLGIAASAPMFIPFVGAFVRLKEYPKSPADDAEVGLAGPIYGVAAALGCFALFQWTQIPVLGGIAHAGAVINLFNLIPIWQLDGGRGFNALDRKQRWIAVGLIALCWFWSGEAMFILLLLGAGYRVFMTPSPAQPGKRALYTYGALILVIALLTQIEVPGLNQARPNS
jgi:Zn-dependent protease